MTSNVVVLIYDGHDPTKDYRAGDVVDIQDGVLINPQTGVERLRTPWLPPAAPFWLVRVWGVDKEGCRFLMDRYAPGSSSTSRAIWQLRQQLVPSSIKIYFTANRFVGFGSAEDHAYYDTANPGVNAGDFVIQWADARTWLYNKETKQTA